MKNVQNIYKKLFILFLTSLFCSSGIFILLFLLKILFPIFAINSSSSFLWFHFLFSPSSATFLVPSVFSIQVFSSPTLYMTLSMVPKLCHCILWFVQISLCSFSPFSFFTSSSHICKTYWKKLKLWMSLSCVLSFILSFPSSLFALGEVLALGIPPSSTILSRVWISGLMSERPSGMFPHNQP